MTDATRVGAIVLAAGAGSRFGGGKLRALLDGKPVLQHVLDTIADARFGHVIVVTGADTEALDAEIGWRGERRVVNPAPERGLSSSVRLAFQALGDADVDAALVLLGDQPRVAPQTIVALLAAPVTNGRPAALPRYLDGTNPNPLLLARSGWHLVDALSGDRGLGPVLRARPELVVDVDVEGVNPDIDTRADLAAASLPAATDERSVAPERQ